MTEPSARRFQASVWITRLIGLWVLFGAALKLVFGNENQLPGVLLQLPIEAELTYRIVIAAEICIALLALLRPRWSWLLVMALLVLFDIMLIWQISQGETNCGCFGARFPVSPIVMLAIDTALLLLLLLSRPWAAPGSDATGGFIAILVVVGAAVLPWVLDRSVDDPSELENAILPPAVRLQAKTWPGARLAETDLARWVDLETLPSSGLWILYRDSCPVCGTLLGYLAPLEDGRREIVLVRMPDEDDVAPKEVHALPEGPWVHTVELADTEWIFTAPGALLVEDGEVVWAVEGIGRLDDFLQLDRR